MAHVRHLVLLKFKEGVDREAAARDISAALANLPAQIPFLNYQFGPDLGIDPERNHDYALVADFPDQAAFNFYATHPAHVQAITTAIKPVLAPGGRAAAQFSIPKQ
jgi:hypothetical protein